MNSKNLTETKPESFSKIATDLKAYNEKYKKLHISLKKELLLAIQEFMKHYGKYTSEIFWIHRSSEYNDEGSAANTGELYFKLTEIANYLIDQTPELQDKLFQTCEHHESTDDFLSLAWRHEKELNKSKTVLKLFILEITKLQNILNLCGDYMLGEMFGVDKEVHIHNTGKVSITEFNIYGD